MCSFVPSCARSAAMLSLAVADVIDFWSNSASGDPRMSDILAVFWNTFNCSVRYMYVQNFISCVIQLQPAIFDLMGRDECFVCRSTKFSNVVCFYTTLSRPLYLGICRFIYVNRIRFYTYAFIVTNDNSVTCANWMRGALRTAEFEVTWGHHVA